MPSLKRKREEDPQDYASANDCTPVKTCEISDTISTFVNRPSYESSVVMKTHKDAYVGNKRKKKRTSNSQSEELKKSDNCDSEASVSYDSTGSMWQVISVNNFRKVHKSFGNIGKTNRESSWQISFPTGKNAGMLCSNDTYRGNKCLTEKHTKSEISENGPRVLNNSSNRNKKGKIEFHEDCRANEKDNILKLSGRTADENQVQVAFVNSSDKIICTSKSDKSNADQNKLNVSNHQNPLKDAYNINDANEFQPHRGEESRRKKIRNVKNVNSNTCELSKFVNGSNLKMVLSGNCDSLKCRKYTSAGVKVQQKFAVIDEKIKGTSQIESRVVKDDDESKNGNKKAVKPSDTIKINDENKNTVEIKKHKSTEEEEIDININCKSQMETKLLINDKVKEKENFNSAKSTLKEEIEKECDMRNEDEELKNNRVEDEVLRVKKRTVNKISECDEEDICENGQTAENIKEEECTAFNEESDADEPFVKMRNKVRRIEIESEDETEEGEENVKKRHRKKLNDKIIEEESSSDEENNSAREKGCNFIDNDDSGDERDGDENESETEEEMLNNKRSRKMMAMSFLDNEAEEGEETENEEEEEEEETEDEISEDENDEELGVEQFIDSEAKEDTTFVKRKRKKMHVIDSDEGGEEEEEKEKPIESENLEKTVHIMKKLTRIMTFGQLKCEALKKQINKEVRIVNDASKSESIEESIRENQTEDMNEIQEDIVGEVKQSEILHNAQLLASVNEELQTIFGEGNDKLKKRRHRKKMGISERNCASDSECQRIQN